MKNKSTLITAILIPLAVGSLSSLISRGGMEVYKTLEKPPLSPPDIVFPIVWTILYILMGISSYLIYTSDSRDKGAALRLYAVQLAMNFLWSIIFFSLMLFLPAFIWLAAMTAVIAAMIYRFYGINKAAAYLNIPYLLWCCFALYLNFGSYILNSK